MGPTIIEVGTGLIASVLVAALVIMIAARVVGGWPAMTTTADDAEAESRTPSPADIRELEQRVEELTRDLAEAMEQQAAANEVLKVIGRSTFDLQPVFETVVQNATRLSKADIGNIYTYDGQAYHLLATYGASKEFRDLLEHNPVVAGRGTIVGKVGLERWTVHIPDVLVDPDYKWSEAQKLGGFRTMLGVPMLKDGVPIGVIVMLRKEVKPFTKRQIELVTTFAAQGVIAIENVNLFHELQTRSRELARLVEQLKALGEVSRAVNSTLELNKVLSTIVAYAVQLSETDGGAIYECDEVSQEFEIRATHGPSEELMDAIRMQHIRWAETVVGQATTQRRPVQVPDIVDEPAGALREIRERSGYRALLAVPLLREDRVVGALVVRRKAPGKFSPDTVDLLQTFAAQSAVAIHNAQLFQALEEKSQQLEVASRHKSEFLANMSHELRTPLNAIIGFSEVLLERMFGDLNPRQDDYLQDICSSGRHLLTLINDILDLSKVEAGRMELELGSFSLCEALENSLMMVRERASHHAIVLSLDIEPQLDLIVADEVRIKQVILNLLTNAVKFTPDGGRVDMTARLVDGEVQVSVRDTGIGIADEDQAHIFEAFQQVSHGPLPKPEGTGLGLALSKKIVELHGGRIWLESQVGVGSTFSFAIPARLAHVEAESASPAASTQEIAAADGAGPMILLIEDDKHAIELLTLYLAGAGFRVAVAHDGEEGLELARQQHPAGIVLDILMPKLDGWDFLARAKADPTIADVPVIIVSMVDERGKGFALGAAEYLVKPVGREELLTALGRVTSIPAVQEAPPKVLAIDDDPMAVNLIEAVLEPKGYTVLKAGSGEEGIALARQEQPVIILLDLLMPEVDGFEVVERLRAEPGTARIPIVILTSQTMTRAEKERLNGQISFLAQKAEFKRADLLELVRNFAQTQNT